MKQKLVSILLAVLMVASLTTACGGKTDTPTATSAPEAETKTEPESKSETESQEAAADNSETEDFTFLDVSTNMIEAGVYAICEDGTELVFSMFTEPSGTPMASLFIFISGGEVDVICGTYTVENETDEDGINWTALTIYDVYRDGEFAIGFGESDEEVYIIDQVGDVYEGQYLTADETIVYMGTATALMEEQRFF